MNILRRRPLILVFWLLVCLGCLRADRVAFWDIGEGKADPAVLLEGYFHRADPCWMGADGAASVGLSQRKVLWLFGDTWVGRPGVCGDGRSRASLIHNSIALQEKEGNRPGRITFYWRRTASGPADAFPSLVGPGWLWPLSGLRVGQDLCLFFARCNAQEDAPGFRIEGSVLVRVSNPDAKPQDWRVRQDQIPFFRHGPEGYTFFGSACVLWEGYVYVYGVKEDWGLGMEGRGLLVARAPVKALETAEFTEWRFFARSRWSDGLEDASILFRGSATEMSVFRLPSLNRFVAVYTWCGVSRKILARTAPRPEGPWARPRLLYQCPEGSWSDRIVCYAGKAHPELAAGRNELVISYVASSTSPDDLFKDLRLYWPRFVRVRFRD